ncbi:DUF1045 domain-containing protein [Phenylobacterium sp.]|uniref:DUF1045 domain-containing protein n=1 Tax=Phenylobacterium sp. TaxID=1871053 RepID=UPI00271F3E70|nr:DUF1045 domain-containing protein [Phenylobacterium sp.]MDO8802352.1 DUF1045 domain-containing protein [Phenylobacterium sp.]
MTARYAIYYAPRPGARLWDKASAWLGFDAYAGAPLTRRPLPGLDALDLDALTADPRGYGFHGTLKAPFELAAGRSEAELLAAVGQRAAGLVPFEVPIAPAALGRFLAFQLQRPSPEMQALHALCVRDFDAFRAPLSDADLARRRKAPLTPEQDARLVEWGYPHVFEDFRFHMTLTGSIRDDAVRTRVLAVLQDHFAEETGAHLFDGVAVFKQDDRQAPFKILERLDFGA